MYRILAAIELRHGFFADGRCAGLQWQPLPETQHWLDSHRCLLRQTDRGLLLLHDTQSPATLAPARLQFSVQARDALFANYTAERTQDSASLLLFDSDAAAEGLVQPTLLDQAAPRTQPWLPLLRQRPPAFALQLTLSEAQLQAVPEAGWRYTCLLQARATIWKYCLVGDWLDSEARELQIVDLARDALFEPASPTGLPGGGAALSFRSTAPIALQQRPAQRLQLRRRGQGEDLVLVKRLPLASAGQLSREVLGGTPTLVSEIYVHR